MLKLTSFLAPELTLSLYLSDDRSRNQSLWYSFSCLEMRQMKMISSQKTFAKLVGASHIISTSIKICFPKLGLK